jgi:hypothetical protein
MSEAINPAIMQHIVEATQHDIDALNSPLPKSFVLERLNRDLDDMRAQVGYTLSQLVSAQPTTTATDFLANSDAAILAEKIEGLKKENPGG